MNVFDTIVAPITGGGRAAVTVVRVSGPDAWKIASDLFSPWRPEPLQAVYGRFSHGDDGIAVPFSEGHSYTGDEAVELSIHGSPASVRALLDRCIEKGARMAAPGEFTQRAFLNGRIDLTQAEAVRDTVDAQTEAQLRLANLQREGSLRREVAAIRELLSKALAAIEAVTDFSDEVGPLDEDSVSADLRDALDRLGALVESSAATRLLRQGLRVAIIGPPNAGKSSLLNAILGTDRAIVTEIPGTTRDTIEEQIEVAGVPVVLVDTAGLRESHDAVETIGIERSMELASNADAVWYVYDASSGWSREDERWVDERVTIVANKCDLTVPEKGISVSALKRTGLTELLGSLPLDAEMGSREWAINSRHRPLLEQSAESILGALDALKCGRPPDLTVVMLQEAIHALGEVTGETASADMIERIFADFCIGK